MADLQLTQEEEQIIHDTRRTGNLNIFTNYFFRLPKSGTRWMPDDRIGHYRHMFEYEQLFDAWQAAGKPDEQFDIRAGGHPYTIDVDRENGAEEFILKHGYLFFDWVKPIIDLRTDIALAVTGTGTSKTSSIAIAGLTLCACYPGFGFMNIAPTEKQAQLMSDELDKWAGGSPFRKFVQETNRRQLYIKKPYMQATIISPLAPRYPSSFACQTIGINSADSILGGSEDMYHIDECGLVPDLHAIIPKVVTRARATRSDGTPRLTLLRMSTNPHPENSSVDLTRQKIEEIQANPNLYGVPIRAVYIDGVNSSVNLYTTKKQMAYQKSMMDHADQLQWHEGSVEELSYTNLIPKKLILGNIDPQLDDEIRLHGLHNAVSREGMGVIQYEMPREEGHSYIVVGDPGKNNAIRITWNNVPVVCVLDVTHFLEAPAKLVYFSMLDGNGTEHPWLNAFRYAMMKYRAPGYYDATNQPGFDAAGAFTNSLEFEYGGRLIKSPSTFITNEVTFASNNKKFARTLFTMLAQDGQFSWPRLEALIHQASIYAEFGVGVKKLADDVLACLFVYCLALRMEGTLWDKVVERYYLPEMDEAYVPPAIVRHNAMVTRGATRSMVATRPHRMAR